MLSHYYIKMYNFTKTRTKSGVFSFPCCFCLLTLTFKPVFTFQKYSDLSFIEIIININSGTFLSP